jgi:hypothetical protein
MTLAEIIICKTPYPSRAVERLALAAGRIIGTIWVVDHFCLTTPSKFAAA